MKIKADQLAKEVAKVLDEYQDATIDVMKNAVDKASKEAVDSLKSDSPKRTGAYAKDWASKNDKQSNKWAYAKVVYNKKHYRLTHLLENGHVLKNQTGVVGRGYVQGNTHIATVEKEAIDTLVKEIKDDA